MAADVADLIEVETKYCSLNRSSLHIDARCGQRIGRNQKIAIRINLDRSRYRKGIGNVDHRPVDHRQARHGRRQQCLMQVGAGQGRCGKCCTRQVCTGKTCVPQGKVRSSFGNEHLSDHANLRKVGQQISVAAIGNLYRLGFLSARGVATRNAM